MHTTDTTLPDTSIQASHLCGLELRSSDLQSKYFYPLGTSRPPCVCFKWHSAYYQSVRLSTKEYVKPRMIFSPLVPITRNSVKHNLGKTVLINMRQELPKVWDILGLSWVGKTRACICVCTSVPLSPAQVRSRKGVQLMLVSEKASFQMSHILIRSVAFLSLEGTGELKSNNSIKQSESSREE